MYRPRATRPPATDNPYSRTPDQADRMRGREENNGYHGYQTQTQQRAAQGLRERRAMKRSRGIGYENYDERLRKDRA